MKTLFQQEAIKRGVLFCGVHNICYSHSNEDITATLGAYTSAFEALKIAVEEGDLNKHLDGEAIQPVFRKA